MNSKMKRQQKRHQPKEQLIQMTRSQLQGFEQQTINNLRQLFILALVDVLRSDYNFGTKRLNHVLDSITSLAESYYKGALDTSDTVEWCIKNKIKV